MFHSLCGVSLTVFLHLEVVIFVSICYVIHIVDATLVCAGLASTVNTPFHFQLLELLQLILPQAQFTGELVPGVPLISLSLAR